MRRFYPLIIFILAILLASCNLSLAQDVTPPPGYQPPPEAQETVEIAGNPLYPLVPPDPEEGERIYVEKCAPCHGSSGLGDGPRAVDLPNPVAAIGASDIARQALPAYWFNIVTQGNLERFMPPFQSLTSRQRWDVIAYSFSLSISRESLLQGAEIYRQQCAGCHGERGEGDGPQAEDIPGELPDFTDQEFMADKSAASFFDVIKAGSLPNMPAFGDELSDDEVWALTDYLRSLTFLPAVADALQETPSLVEESALQPENTAAGDDAPAEVSEATEPPVDPPSPNNVEGIVFGSVTNASSGETPAGLEVALHGFDQMQIVITDTTTTLEDGTYIFENVEIPEGRSFLATVEYGGAIYGSEVVSAGSGETSIDLPIQVYETTTDPSTLYVDRLHYFFEFLNEGIVRVVELYIISNPGSKTIIASQEDQPVLRFSIPSEAANLDIENGVLGGRYVLTEDGFGDTLPIRPGMGQYQILFSYEMPYDSSLDLTRPMNLATNAVVILVPEDSINVKGENIQDAGIRDVQGVQYHMFSGGALDPGDELHLTVTGRSGWQNSFLSIGSNTNLLIGLGALGVVMIIVGIWFYTRRRSARVEDMMDIEDLPKPATEDPETVMDAILALDDLYQEGQLPEDAYLQRREKLKDQLKGLLADE